jgi:hypothetical protein
MTTTTTDPNPPWYEFPGEAFYWGGWKQGSGQVWMSSVFVPFWLAATPEQRKAYLTKWPPPDDEWQFWVSHFETTT